MTEEDIPPIWHTFVPRSASFPDVAARGIACADCGRWPTHHFHTGIVGAAYGCDDCRPVSPVLVEGEHMTSEGRIVVPSRSPFVRLGRYFRKSKIR